MQLIINHGSVTLPVEFYEFLNNTSYGVVYKKKNGATTWFKPINFPNFLRIIFNIVTSQSFLFFQKRSEINKNIIYKKIIGINIKNLIGTYRIVNYETKFVLFKSKNIEIAQDRESFWEQISNYNEHKKLVGQNKISFKRTQWLADVICGYNPDSVLELGCGAGRNLAFISKKKPNCELFGVEVNQNAIHIANEELKGKINFISNSVYEINHIQNKSIDVVFTSGLLMHIPHDKVKMIINECIRISKVAVIHYELHGPSHKFDFHRYPRDYRLFYEHHTGVSYKIFSRNEFKGKGTDSFNHSLLIYKHT